MNHKEVFGRISNIKTSIGIICYRLENSMYDIFIKNINDIENIEKISYNINSINISESFKYDKYIKFLLVNRRNSLNYIDFMRGKYNLDDLNSIIKMASYMSKDEIELLKNNNFNKLWTDLWLKNSYKKKYLYEMKKSNEKFNYLKSINFFDNLISEYSSTEWELPKGGQKQNETYINCAIREFEEETSITKDNYKILKCNEPIYDIFTGTNNIEYRHIFYTALLTNNDIEEYQLTNNNEIASIKWCSWSELNNIIRPYNNSKIKILTLIFLFIINICSYKNNQSINISQSI
jgi:8-oxo-dGTP pyrophosphatase MutT (NUDIX family)